MHPVKPTSDEINQNLKKIERWKILGFNTDGLEELLREDYEKFKERKLKILAGQISPDMGSHLTEEKGETVKAPRGRKHAIGEVNVSTEHRAEPSPVSPLELESHTNELPIEAILQRSPDKKERKKEIGETESRKEATSSDSLTKSMDKGDLIPTGVKALEETVVQDSITAHRSTEAVPTDIVLVGKPQKLSKPIEEMVEGVIILDNEEEPEEDDRYNYYEIPKEEPEDEDAEKRGDIHEKRGDIHKKRKSRSKEDEHRTRDTLIAVGVFFMLVVFGIGILNPDLFDWDFNGSGDPEKNGNGDSEKPEIIIISPVNDTTYQTGELITFNAEVDYPEGNINSLKWDFGDSNFAQGNSTTHFYTSDGERTYVATFTAKVISGEVYQETVSIHIVPMVITLPEKKDGMGAIYNLFSTIIYSDPEGIPLFSDEKKNIVVTDVELDGEGKQEVEIVFPGEEIEDGFLIYHDVYGRYVTVKQNITGNATVEYSGPFVEPGKTKMYLKGSADINNKNYFDLTTKEVIKSELHSIVDLFSEYDEQTSYKMTDDIINYQDRSVPSINIDITEIRENRTFKLGDKEPGGVGGLHYMWSIDEIDNVRNTPTLKVNVKLDKELLASYGITYHTMHLWIANGTALPVKFHLNMVQEDDDSTFSVDLMGEMILSSYESGDRLLSDLQCDSDHNVTRWDEKDADLGNSFSEMKYVPATGEDIETFNGFTIEDAMGIVEGDDGFITYMDAHPKAFGIDSRFSQTDGGMLWNITFGEKGSTDGINFLVYEDDSLTSRTVDTGEVTRDSSNLGEVLDYGGAVSIFRQHSTIKEVFYNNGELDLPFTTMGAGTSLPTLSIEAFYTGNVNNLDFGFFLTNTTETGEGSTDNMAVLNGRTGQILYVMDHTESIPSLDPSNFI